MTTSVPAYAGTDDLASHASSRAEYLVDVDEWGYEDAHKTPRGSMTEEQIAVWTAAIDRP